MRMKARRNVEHAMVEKEIAEIKGHRTKKKKDLADLWIEERNCETSEESVRIK